MNDEDLCPGCQHPAFHKMCPAYGTPYYMSGERLPDELYREDIPDKFVHDPTIDLTNELNLHIWRLTVLRLNGLSEENKEKLIECWEGILGIDRLNLENF